MQRTKKDLVIGVFEQDVQAEQAVSDLWKAGFAPDRIDMANRRMGVVPGTPRLQFQKDAAEGATTGAVAGAATGAVAGAVAGSLLPGIGTVSAASAEPRWAPPAALSSVRSWPWRFPRTMPTIIPTRSIRVYPRDRPPDWPLRRSARHPPQSRGM